MSDITITNDSLISHAAEQPGFKTSKTDLSAAKSHSSNAVQGVLGNESQSFWSSQFSVSVGAHMGVAASEFTENHGSAALGLELGLQAPYGFGIETKLGYYKQATTQHVDEKSSLKDLQEHPDWDLNLTRGGAEYFFPTVLQFRTPPVFELPVDLSVGAGLALQKSSVGERLTESHTTTTYTKPNTDFNCDEDDINYNSSTDKCSHSQTDTHVIQDSIESRGFAVKPVVSASLRFNPFAGFPFYVPWWSGTAGVSIGYMHFHDFKKPELNEDVVVLGLSASFGLGQ